MNWVSITCRETPSQAGQAKLQQFCAAGFAYLTTDGASRGVVITVGRIQNPCCERISIDLKAPLVFSFFGFF